MNLAEQILRRRHEAMYKTPVALPTEPQPPAPEQSSQRQRPISRANGTAPSATGVDAVLTRDGRIRRARQDANRTGSMSDINVDLDL